jgi:large subunit ribosomal protein L25
MAEATHIPEAIEISVEGLAAGTTLRGVDLTLPTGVTLVGDPEEPVVSISVPQSSETADETEASAPEASEEA